MIFNCVSPFFHEHYHVIISKQEPPTFILHISDTNYVFKDNFIIYDAESL